jgi:cell division septation protein DedD
MEFRVGSAFLLALLLAGCAEFSGFTSPAPTADYAMASPEPVAEAQAAQELPPSSQTAALPQGKFGVQIAAPRSVEQARALIDSMRARYPNELGKEWAAILPVTLPKGTFYRVVIGPMASEQQASQLCGRLKSQGTECFIRRT